MIKRACLYGLLLVVLTACSSSRSGSLLSYDRTSVYNDIAYLADDKLDGRAVGTKGELLAAGYIGGRFQALGLEKAGDHHSFYQQFSRKVSDNPHATPDEQNSKTIKGRNVVAFLDHGADNTVIIGAHYDHLASDSPFSLGEAVEVHNGADDNASGVAGMLALAETLKNGPKNNNYLFIAFSGEERGLWGSNYYAKNPTINLKTVNYMINMDMIGRLDKSRGLAMHGTGTSPQWRTILDQVKKKFSKLPIKEHESGTGPSDFTSFYLQDIPVLSFFTGQHEDYHKPTDDIEKINFDGMKTVLSLITSIISEADQHGRLAFSKTKDESSQAPRFTVTLGVIPDYLFDGKGMRIDGVKEDRTAAKGGLQKGDIVVQLGEHPVNDMMSYMQALSTFKKGDQTTVVVKRNDEKLEKSIQFD